MFGWNFQFPVETGLVGRAIALVVRWNFNAFEKSKSCISIAQRILTFSFFIIDREKRRAEKKGKKICAMFTQDPGLDGIYYHSLASLFFFFPFGRPIKGPASDKGRGALLPRARAERVATEQGQKTLGR